MRQAQEPRRAAATAKRNPMAARSGRLGQYVSPSLGRRELQSGCRLSIRQGGVWREGGREREGDSDSERERDRQTDRLRETEIGRKTETESQTLRERERERE